MYIYIYNVAAQRRAGYLVNEHIMYMKEYVCITGYLLNVFHECLHKRMHDLRTHVHIPDLDAPTTQLCSYLCNI